MLLATIDPGTGSGRIVIFNVKNLDDYEIKEVVKIPLSEPKIIQKKLKVENENKVQIKEFKRKQINYRKLFLIFKELKKLNTVFLIESYIVKSIDDEHTTKVTWGGIVATLKILDIEPFIISPMSWKSYFNLLRSDKETSVKKAQELFTNKTWHGLFKDHNIAEAALIGYFGLKKHEGLKRRITTLLKEG